MTAIIKAWFDLAFKCVNVQTLKCLNTYSFETTKSCWSEVLQNRTAYYGHDGTNKMATGIIWQTPESLKEILLLTYADSGGEWVLFFVTDIFKNCWYHFSFSSHYHLTLCVFPSGRSLLFWWLKKGRVWVCRFFVENTIRQRRMEIFCKTAGLNLLALKTRIYLCHRNGNTGRKDQI